MAVRSPTPVFEFADRFIDEHAALDPISATSGGIPGHDDRVTDWSPDGYAERAEHTRRGLAAVQAMPVTDEADRLARDFIVERFTTSMLAFDTGEWQRAVRAIAAPSSSLRSTFDLMSRDGVDAWEHIAARLHLVPTALDGLRATYELGRDGGSPAALRQVIAAADQASTWATDRWFDSLAVESAAVVGLPGRDRRP